MISPSTLSWTALRRIALGAYGITFATVFQNSKLAKGLASLARYSCGS